MKLWIRVDAATPRDPKVAELADRLGISTPAAVGHLVMLWGVMAEHTPDGLLRAVGVRALERWAGWTGRKGRFHQVFFDLFVTDGTVNGWEKRQGALIARMEKDRARKFHGNSTEGRRNSAPTERNGTEQPTTTTCAPNHTARADKPRESWLLPPSEVWEEFYGPGSFRWPKAGKLLKPLAGAGRTGEEIAANLRRCLAKAKAENRLRYVTLARFAETFADYGEFRFQGPPVVDGWMSDEVERLSRPPGCPAP